VNEIYQFEEMLIIEKTENMEVDNMKIESELNMLTGNKENNCFNILLIRLNNIQSLPKPVVQFSSCE
jgi:hypothetical protein